jgi:hypothetical protein
LGFGLKEVRDVAQLLSELRLLPNRRDLALGEHREGHDGDFPELDFGKEARAVGSPRRALRAKADGEAVERAVAKQRGDVAGAFDIGGEVAADVEAAGILADRVPHADRLVREVLIEHAHGVRRTFAQTGGEGAFCDDIAGGVGHVPQRGVTGELIRCELGEPGARVHLREAAPHVLDLGHVIFFVRRRF